MSHVYITTGSVVQYQTELTTVKLMDSNGDPLDTGNIKYYEQMHIKTGTYNDKPKMNRKRFDSRFSPPNKGGCFIRFTYDSVNQKIERQVML